jgi:hypothetical protein
MPNMERLTKCSILLFIYYDIATAKVYQYSFHKISSRHSLKDNGKGCLATVDVCIAIFLVIRYLIQWVMLVCLAPGLPWWTGPTPSRSSTAWAIGKLTSPNYPHVNVSTAFLFVFKMHIFIQKDNFAKIKEVFGKNLRKTRFSCHSNNFEIIIFARKCSRKQTLYKNCGNKMNAFSFLWGTVVNFSVIKLKEKSKKCKTCFFAFERDVANYFMDAQTEVHFTRVFFCFSYSVCEWQAGPGQHEEGDQRLGRGDQAVRYLHQLHLPGQSTKYLQYIQRVPQCMSPRRNWDSPIPSPASECAPPPGPKGGGRAHSPVAKGVGESQFRLEKKLSTLPTLLVRGNSLWTKYQTLNVGFS